MVDVTVIRYQGDISGDDIVSNYLNVANAAVTRGEYEINNETIGFQFNLRVKYRPNVKPGDVVEIRDTLQNYKWRGYIESVDININIPEATLNLTIFVPEITKKKIS